MARKPTVAQPTDNQRDPFNVAVGNRLRELCGALDFKTDKEFADAIGLKQNHYAKIQQGKGLLTPQTAVRVREVTRATLEYLYMGNEDRMPEELMAKILRYRENLKS